MAPLKDIKKGIQSGDWALVTKGYNALTGDDLTAPVVAASAGPMTLEQITEALKALQTGSPRSETPVKSEKPPKQVVKTKKKAGRPRKAAKKADDTEEIDGEIPTGKPDLNVSPQERKIIPYTTEAVNPKIAKKNQLKAESSGKQYRLPYKPKMMKCKECKHQYDGKKEIAGGVIGDKGTTKYKCPKCGDIVIE